MLVDTAVAEDDAIPAIVRLQPLGGIIRQAGSHSGDHPKEVPELSVELLIPGNSRVDLPAGGFWRVELDAPGYWAPPVTWSAEAGPRVVLAAVPTGDLVGRLVPPEGEEPPEELAARFQEAGLPPGDGDADRHLVPCELTEDRGFRCPVPAGRRDVRLRAPAFVSHYFWDLDVPPGGRVDLEEIRLHPGSSLVAWVAAEEPPDEFDPTRITATLIPETAGLQDLGRDSRRRSLLQMEARANERGFLEIVGMAPGTYVLRVEHPAFAPVRLSPVVIAEGSETEVESVVLRPPLQLEVRVEPPRDPRGRSWVLGLSRHSDVPGHLDLVAEGTGDAEGRWLAGGLTSGDYRLVVSDGSDARWSTQEVRLEGGDLRLDVELPFERVEGRVMLGGEPLPGVRVWFGGEHGETRVSALSDEEGAVYVFLPVREEWPVEVRAKRPPIVARLDAVEIEDHPSEPWRLAEIELPDTGLSGVVLGPEGTPVPEAKVRLTRERLPARFLLEWTGEDGRFAIQAIQDGRWRAQGEWVDPEGRRWLSDGVEVAITEGEEPPELELQLRRSWTFEGQIVSPTGGGVFGAEVTGLPLYPEGGERGTYLASAITGLSGEFELEVPAEATAVQLTVLPPGFTARRFAPFERGTAAQVLEVDSHGGTLRIGNLDASSTVRPEELPTVFSRSGRWGILTLIRWARMAGGEAAYHGGDLVIPRMPADLYQVCPPGTGLAAAGGGEAGCSSGELPPYGQLTLELAPER